MSDIGVVEDVVDDVAEGVVGGVVSGIVDGIVDLDPVPSNNHDLTRMRTRQTTVQLIIPILDHT